MPAWIPLETRQARADAGDGIRIRLVTVPHTGRFFTIGLLKQVLDKDQHDARHTKFWNRKHREYWRDFPKRRAYILCTLRDPMMAIISSINQGQTTVAHGQLPHTVEAWRIIAGWKDEPNVHFFSIDGPVSERKTQLRGLADFCGARNVPVTDWAPVNTSPDTRDLKSGYQAGNLKADIGPAFDLLTKLPDVKALFADHGYSLPWMA